MRQAATLVISSISIRLVTRPVHKSPCVLARLTSGTGDLKNLAILGKRNVTVYTKLYNSRSKKLRENDGPLCEGFSHRYKFSLYHFHIDLEGPKFSIQYTFVLGNFLRNLEKTCHVCVQWKFKSSKITKFFFVAPGKVQTYDTIVGVIHTNSLHISKTNERPFPITQ